MTLKNGRFNIVSSSPVFNNPATRLNRFQCELMSEAMGRAVNDAVAAMTHQLSEPVTALLLYLYEIKRVGETSDSAEAIPASMREMVNRALHETERIRSIIEQAGHMVETPPAAESALARGREAIDSWRRNSQVNTAHPVSSVESYAGEQSLTPREREVLALIAGGASNKEGGYQLGISTRTFEAHRAHLMGKLGAKNAADLVRIALNNDQ